MNLKSKLSSALAKKSKIVKAEKSKSEVIIEKTPQTASESVDSPKTSNLSSKFKHQLKSKISPVKIDVETKTKPNIDTDKQKPASDRSKLSESDLLEIEKLEKRYNIPFEFIWRGFECSRRLGIGFEYFINRYLNHDNTPFRRDFETVYKEILNENRIRLWSIQ